MYRDLYPYTSIHSSMLEAIDASLNIMYEYV